MLIIAWLPMLGAVQVARSVLLNNVHVALSVLLHVVAGGVYFAGTWAMERGKVQHDAGNAVIVFGSVPVAEADNVRAGRQPVVLQKRKVEYRPTEKAERVVVEPIKRIPPPPGRKAMERERLVTQPQQQAAPPAVEPLPVAADAQDFPETAEQELSGILQAVQREANIGPPGAENEVDSGEAKYDEKHELAVRIANSIRSRFVECWTVPAGAKDVENMVVKVGVVLAPSGKVVRAGITDTHLYNSNPFFRAVADSALRAVYKCSPLMGLNRNDYNLWHEIVLTFNPKPEL